MFNNFLVRLVAFLLPTQLGLHFWPEFSRVLGLKIDYLSPTIYFIYIPLVVLQVLNLKTIIGSFIRNKRNTYLFLCLILFNLLFSSIPQVSFYKWLEIILYLNTYLILSKIKNLWSIIKSPFTLSFYLVFLLQLLQLFSQSSLNGIFYYLGERSFTASTPSIPKVNFTSISFIRPLSTFSHPNSLAGYLVVCLGIFHTKKEALFKKSLVIFSLFFTFSKAAIISIFVVFSKVYKLRLIFICLAIFSLLLLFTNQKFNLQSLDARIEGYQYSQKVLGKNLVLGTGLGNYIPELAKTLPGSQITPNTLQPVHNSLLLVVSELGLVGTFFLILIFKPFKVLKPLKLLLALVLFTSIFDHYWLTLVQNKLLLTTALSLYPLQYKHETLSNSTN